MKIDMITSWIKAVWLFQSLFENFFVTEKQQW